MFCSGCGTRYQKLFARRRPASDSGQGTVETQDQDSMSSLCNSESSAGWLLPLLCWTRSTPSFAPPGGERRAGAGRRLLLLHLWKRSTPSFARDIFRFSPLFSPGNHLIHFLVFKMKDFRNIVLCNCILVFDSGQVYLKLQVPNFKNKEVTVNPKPQTLEKNWVFENPIP